MNKRAAIEMSMGTIVTLVLSMTLLILLIVVIRNIAGSANNAVDLTDQQLTSEINKLFGNDQRLAIYPASGLVEVKSGKSGDFGFGIKNMLQGSEGENVIFSYETAVVDVGKCGRTVEELESLISLGSSGSNIIIPPGHISSTQRVRFEIPSGFPLCSFRVSVLVKAGENNYASDAMDITIK